MTEYRKSIKTREFEVTVTVTRKDTGEECTAAQVATGYTLDGVATKLARDVAGPFAAKWRDDMTAAERDHRRGIVRTSTEDETARQGEKDQRRRKAQAAAREVPVQAVTPNRSAKLKKKEN